jgi:signal transduction histidine kinase
VGIPGVALLYGAWVLPRADVDPDLFPRVSLWCFGVMAVVITAVTLALLRPGSVIPDPEGTLLSLAALGGAGGLAIGLHEGRAITQSRQREEADQEAAAHRRRKELEEIQSVIAHDVKSPLYGIYGNIDLARDTGDLAHLDDAERAAKRVEELVEDLRRLAREGVAVADPDSVPLADVVHEVWGGLGKSEATLDVVDLEGATVEADRRRLTRLLDNLLRNALTHGGSDVRIEVGALDDASGFYVQDDGLGFPGGPEKALEVGYTSHKEGTGFGLPLVDRIARAHGWSLDLDESADGGARIEVRT